MRLEAALNEYIVLPMHISERSGLEKRSNYIASVHRIEKHFQSRQTGIRVEVKQNYRKFERCSGAGSIVIRRLSRTKQRRKFDSMA